MKSLQGLSVMITGAARGIGAETARQLAERGARLALVGLEPARLAALAADLGPSHCWAECDVTDYGSLEQATAQAVAALHGLDVVVANAGIANNGTVAVSPAEALAKTIEVNLIGVMHTVSATLPALAESRGYYLLVSSAAALGALPGMSAYCASKAGVEQFGNALRLEVAHKGIDVGVVFPGWVNTDLVRDQQRDLQSFNKMLKSLPWPLNVVTPVEPCAATFVEAIAQRRRTQYIPRAMAIVAALRPIVRSQVWESFAKRQARAGVPVAEQEVQALGRSFGANSMGTAALQRKARR